jgi:hypothetical protein
MHLTEQRNENSVGLDRPAQEFYVGRHEGEEAQASREAAAGTGSDAGGGGERGTGNPAVPRDPAATARQDSEGTKADETESLAVEQLDDRLRKAREIVKRANERFSYSDPRFIERYREGACNLGLRRAFGDTREYGLIVGAYPAGFETFNTWAGHSKNSRRRLYPQQSAMLAHDVELMEGPQKFVPSLIWVQRFDDRSFGRRQPLFAFETCQGVNEVEQASIDRKVFLNVLRHAVARIECAGEDVEAAADGIEVNAGCDMERERQRLFLDHHYEIIRDIRIRVFDSYFEIEIEPSVDLRVKGWELGYGPVNARLRM